MTDGTWTRRRFTASAAALAALAHGKIGVGQAGGLGTPLRSQGDSPEVISGGLIPLTESNVARPLRYTPEANGLTIRGGRQMFNRPLYGRNIAFRADAGDLPEFSLYLPGHGGNLRLGLARTGLRTQWLHASADIVTQYTNGRMLYEVRDPLLGKGVVRVEAMTLGAALWVGATGEGLPADVWLTWAFAGVSGRKGRRNGDIGCEVEPVSRFFQVRPEECKGNVWTLANDAAEVVSGKIKLSLNVAPGAELRVVDGAAWTENCDALWASQAGELPALAGRARLENDATKWVSVKLMDGVPTTTAFTVEARREELLGVTRGLAWRTPDAYLDGMAGPLTLTADTVWDEAQSCVMHGAVAWRAPLAGWRGLYALDLVGRHDRMQRHLRHWIAKQNVSDVINGSGGTATANGFTGIVEATGEPDKGSAQARTEHLLHSNGDLSGNHYDMNLVFFDALLRHLRWTGDLDFAREVWPALERHAAWERRLFRREYGTAAQTSPLYEAYAVIWASDNLQYDGGGAAYSSAYNVFLNRGMAEIAALLHDPSASAYRAEADATCAAMREQLWMPERGAFAESREWLGDKRLAIDPAVWTVYHVIDSEVATPKEAWQMAAERLRAIRKIPVVGAGVPEGGWQMACSDWLPYVWSLTLLCLAENTHMALALYQAGMAEEGYALLRGNVVDACYRGLCPGNFPMSLQLDPHRQESQRDFADPMSCTGRAVVEGMWGVQPRLLQGRLHLRPQLPAAWEHAEFDQADLSIHFVRQEMTESWTIASKFAKPVVLSLELVAWTTSLPKVKVNGADALTKFNPVAVGCPTVLLEAAPAQAWTVTLEWQGERPVQRSGELVCTLGAEVAWPRGVDAATLDDPQGCLDAAKRPKKAGGFTVFAAVEQGACRYWLPLELKVREVAKPALVLPVQRYEPVELGSLLDGSAAELLTRPHRGPRSGLTSLNLPDGLLGGWANFDVKAVIDDSGLRNSGGAVRLADGLVFRTPEGTAANCCYVSQWQGDRRRVELPLSGTATSLNLLLACTTFPQATRSLHGIVEVRYADGGPAMTLELRSPTNWWPVEQDYLVDDYIFRLEPYGEPATPFPMRVDLRTGMVRRAGKGRGGFIRGGSATVLTVPVDAYRTLASLHLSCERYGVVMGVLGVTLGRMG